MEMNSAYYEKTNKALIFCILWCIAPPMLVNGPCRFIAIICMLYCLARNFLLTQYSGVVIFWLVYTAIIGMFIQGFQYIIAQMQLLIVVAFAYIAEDKSFEYFFENKRKILEKIIMFVYPVFMLTTLREYITNPRISRMLVGNGAADVVMYSYRGVGGYGMIYSLVFHNVICLYILIHRQKHKKLIIVNYILSLFTVLNAGYSIALISLVVGSSIVIIFGREEDTNGRGLGAKFLLILIAFIFFLIFKEKIIESITNMVQGTMYQAKWADILDSIESDSAKGTFADRQMLYEYSFQNFIQYPITGTWVTGGFMFGGHSLILDMFARFGIIGGIPFLYTILHYPITQVKERRCIGLSIAILFDIIFIGLFNNWAAALAPIVYLLYPMIVEESVDDCNW